MLLIKNGHIKTMAGSEFDNGAILIGDDGKIAAVGKDIPCPEGATVIDAQDRLVTPGCVDAHCHVGLDNQGMGWEGRDYNEIVDPITPQMRAIDSINPMDEAFALAEEAPEVTPESNFADLSIVIFAGNVFFYFFNVFDNFVVTNCCEAIVDSHVL